MANLDVSRRQSDCAESNGPSANARTRIRLPRLHLLDGIQSRHRLRSHVSGGERAGTPGALEIHPGELRGRGGETIERGRHRPVPEGELAQVLGSEGQAGD